MRWEENRCGEFEVKRTVPEVMVTKKQEPWSAVHHACLPQEA